MICIRVVILNFVQVMYWFGGFRLWRSGFLHCLGIIKEYMKKFLFLWSVSIVPSEREHWAELLGYCTLLILGIFTSHLWVGFTSGSLWLNCNRYPCTISIWKDLGLYMTFCGQSPSVSLKQESYSCFQMVLKSVFISLYRGFGRLFLHSFSFPSDQPVSPKGPISDSRSPSHDLGSWPPSWITHC